MVHNFYFVGQLWEITPDGKLKNYCESNWECCKRSPWVIPEEGKEGHVKIGHEPNEYGNQDYLRKDRENNRVYVLTQKGCPESDAWKWKRSTNKNGWFTLQNKSDGRFLTAFDSGNLGLGGKNLILKIFHFFY